MGKGGLTSTYDTAAQSEGLHLRLPGQLRRAKDTRLPNDREEPDGLLDHQDEA